MFKDIDEIMDEIEKFRVNMNSVDGLMMSLKDVCSRLERQREYCEELLKKTDDIIKDNDEKFIHACENLDNHGQNLLKEINKKYQENQILLEEKSQIYKRVLEEQQENARKYVERSMHSLQQFQAEHQKKLDYISNIIIEQKKENQSLFQRLIQMNKRYEMRLNLIMFGVALVIIVAIVRFYI